MCTTIFSVFATLVSKSQDPSSNYRHQGNPEKVNKDFGVARFMRLFGFRVEGLEIGVLDSGCRLGFRVRHEQVGGRERGEGMRRPCALERKGLGFGNPWAAHLHLWTPIDAQIGDGIRASISTARATMSVIVGRHHE